jgi:uncharacterized membrane protein YjgN (DUF898 family)
LSDLALPSDEVPAQPALPASSAAPPAAPLQPFRFQGKAQEYFGIWIVNLLLTIVTLGLYSPWAKVRRKRYFYGNTWLAGSNFEYHGNPVAILKGRLIAVVAFGAYTLVTHYWPRYGALLLLAMAPAVPWLVVRTFAFNAVNSSYRNLRFGFRGRYREAARALWPLLVGPVLALVLPQADPEHPAKRVADMGILLVAPGVLALVYPYVLAKVQLLHLNRSRYGTAAMHCSATVGQFYRIYILAGIMFAGLVFILGLLLGILVAVTLGIGIALVPLVYIVFVALMMGYTRSRVGNLVFNATALDGGWRLRSTLKARELANLYTVNLFAIVLTLGFMIPWAAVRTARYRAEHLALAGAGDLDAFAAGSEREIGAAGEEMGEMFDVDLSL